MSEKTEIRAKSVELAFTALKVLAGNRSASDNPKPEELDVFFETVFTMSRRIEEFIQKADQSRG